MRSGRLRWLVTIEHSPEPQNRGELGGYEAQWVPLAEVFAEINPLNGRALEAAQSRHGEVTAEIPHSLPRRRDGCDASGISRQCVRHPLRLQRENQYRELILGCSLGTSDGG